MQFYEAWPIISSVEGFLAEAEAEVLFMFAKALAGNVLEIGSFKGRTAVLFALALRETD